ncbi:Asp-tRNA(Asn)/Glu-tRNA(Gln) amidotransferase subunit GatC [Candidatus Saccharibacteria bacterium]|nr:Asp-tRNA(Asn)/Glu-tRNA(Gln) amidotransferase subunit GatC [Candidatus Saccharibacteria bacterium]
MAKLTRDDVLHLAKLARLQLSDEEAARLQEELGSILGYVKQLESVDVTDMKPTTQVSGLQNVMRADEPVNYQAKREELLKLAPGTQDEQLKVRRMVG